MLEIFEIWERFFELISHKNSLIIKDNLLKRCEFEPWKTLTIPMNERDLTSQKTKKSRLSSPIRTDKTKTISLWNRDICIS